MNILVSNDDGILALEAQLQELIAGLREPTDR